MRNITIFEKVKGRLFAACFSPDEIDELEKAFFLWRDLFELHTFFVRYRKDLDLLYPGIRVKQAIEMVSSESDSLFDRFRTPNIYFGLEDLFQPLDNREHGQRRYEGQKLKAKAGGRKNFLRVYGINFDNGVVVTGSAIKLTQRMDQRPHLLRELKKLETVRLFLQDERSRENFVYLDSE